MGLGFLENGFHIQHMNCYIRFFNNTNERILHTLIRFVISSVKFCNSIVVVSIIVLECAYSLAATSVLFLDRGQHHITKI
jgi:hypothetical protein